MSDQTSEDLVRGIKGWLNSKGYPLEMEVSRTLNLSGFHVFQGWNYTDPESGKSREIDILASRTIASTNILLFQVIIECKKSDNPFIAFSYGPHLAKAQHSFWLPGNHMGQNFLNHLRSTDIINRLPAFQLMSPIAYSLAHAHIGKNKGEKEGKDGIDSAYEALMVVSKASISMSLNYSEKATKMPDPSNPSSVKPVVYIGLPVIVTDAPIFICYLDEKGELAIQRKPDILVEWSFPSVGILMIRVCSLENLPNLCSQINASLEQLESEAKNILTDMRQDSKKFIKV